MLHSKKTAEGAKERVDALVQGWLSDLNLWRNYLPGVKVGRDDFLDACAALWTAKRIANREVVLPVRAERDARGLDMAIWY